MWTYEQKTGKLSHNGEVVATGYAGGNCGKNPEGKNSPEHQSVPKVGPVPQGKYKFGTPVAQSHLGPFAIPLIPDPTNEMFGRSDFYMHGDTISNPGCASEGCIIVPRNIRNAVASSPDQELEVVAE